MGKIIRSLYIDSHSEDRKLVRADLGKHQGDLSFHIIECCDDPAQLLTEGNYDIILTERDVAGYQDLNFLQFIRNSFSNIPVIVFTSEPSVENSVQAMKMGVADYIIKSDEQFIQLTSRIQSVYSTYYGVHENTGKKDAIPVMPHQILHEKMMDGFAFVSMDGKIKGSNLAFQQMIGYNPEELTHLTYRDITPEKWHDIEAELLQEQILPNGFSEVYEKEYRNKAGIVFPVELRTSLRII